MILIRVLEISGVVETKHAHFIEYNDTPNNLSNNSISYKYNAGNVKTKKKTSAQASGLRLINR